MKILLTGGAGYIGSTIASALEDNGHIPVILDSLINGREEFTYKKIFYRGDIADADIIAKIFNEHPDIQNTIHCAAHIIVPESVKEPYKYYYENIYKTLMLLKYLQDHNMGKLLFSSSASLYNLEGSYRANEDSPTGTDSPYAFSKLVIENMLADFSTAYGFKSVSLRYFNPVGADPQMRSGPYDQNPSHLLGSLIKTASGMRKTFEITGVDWPTRDGSAIRDFVHVWDLARAHVLAVEKFDNILETEHSNYLVINLGSEKGTTVREFLACFEQSIARQITKIERPPRPGDKVGAYASSERAARLLGWKAELSIEQGITDAIKWDKIKEEKLCATSPN